MDRNTVVRWALIAAALLLFWKFGMPLITGGNKKPQTLSAEVFKNAPDFVPDKIDPKVDGKPNEPKEGELCELKGERFKAQLSSRGAAIVHLRLTDGQYADDNGQIDMSTTPDHEQWRSLRTGFRANGADDQVDYDRFNWKLQPQESPSACTFTYTDAKVEITKTIRAASRAFELEMTTQVKNLTDAPKKHALSTSIHAFRYNKEIKGKLGRVSPFMTDLACAGTDEVVRKGKDDFKEGWVEKPSVDRFAAISNYYFGQAIIPAAGDKPNCRIVADLLADKWAGANIPHDDENAGAVYHAVLNYPTRELKPQEAVTYTQSAFFGPKERDALAAAAGGRPKLGELINLGFFSPVAKVLVSILLFFHGKLGNWGFAIILMTICVRLVLFPLAIPGIKSSIAMRKLRPQIEAIHAKFKDDPEARGLATLELQKKNGGNMLAGCLPQLAQMPVWWAMYTTLQTAVEMYHTKFAWFQDLSAPDKYFILPIVLGGLGLLQARIMPQQPGQDPAQQKMMMYMMPAIFTVMMLFLPAALGVYMTTNSILGIAQAKLIEHFAKKAMEKSQKGEIGVTEVSSTSALEKGKARV
ncbi:MAG: membrane protein insertase YidC [Polyangiaceae bacterium]|nr:membrane protein insertase YidC [Polyangiaceae bacterium]